MTLLIDLRDDEVALLAAKAGAHGLTTERYARMILERDLEADAVKRPISAAIREIWSAMPEDVRATLPVDGASQVDHYVYGHPKRKS
jgi:plasmid stability protein